MTKPPRPEKDYFGRQDAIKARKIAEEKKSKFAEAELKKLKEQHWHRCPKCGMDMEEVAFKGCNVLKCLYCEGAFLDGPSVEKLCGNESTFMETLIELFRFK